MRKEIIEPEEAILPLKLHRHKASKSLGFQTRARKVGAIGLEPQAESSQQLQSSGQLSGCVARILAAPKTKIESFMPFYKAERSSAESV